MADLPSAAAAAAPCPACLEGGRPLRLTCESHRLHACSSCRTQYFRPDPGLVPADQDPEARSEHREAYKSGHYATPSVQAAHEERYDRALRTAQVVLGRRISTVLDAGCGIGNFVQYAERRGLIAYGADVDEKAVAAGRDRGLAVATVDELDRLIGKDGVLDAVTLWDVIEHLHEPDVVVRSCVARLAPDGVFVLRTPDAAFPVRKAVRALHAVTGGRADLTGGLYRAERRTCFTVAGLRSILRRCGADVVSVRRATSPGAWPVLDAAARRAGVGDKLIVVARKRSKH